MLIAKDLTFSYPKGDLIEFPDINVKNNEEWLILGPSGCGKTTLLHLLCGLLHPTSGLIKLNNIQYHQLSSYKLDKFRGKYFGIIFQSSHLIRSLTALDNVLLAQSLGGKKSKEDAKKLLNDLGMGHRLNHLPGKLSIGEQQRVGIARAVACGPEVILADEPTSALDDESADRVLDLLRERAQLNNSALVIVTHDQRLKDKINNTIVL